MVEAFIVEPPVPSNIVRLAFDECLFEFRLTNYELQPNAIQPFHSLHGISYNKEKCILKHVQQGHTIDHHYFIADILH